jgi:phenylpyruvate tautomerase PptA (4-oxalocrotonate tautomerase family)
MLEGQDEKQITELAQGIADVIDRHLGARTKEQ